MAFLQVTDARGEPRVVYNLRAWHRSPEAQRAFPEPLLRSICQTVVGIRAIGPAAAVTESQPH